MDSNTKNQSFLGWIIGWVIKIIVLIFLGLIFFAFGYIYADSQKKDATESNTKDDKPISFPTSFTQSSSLNSSSSSSSSEGITELNQPSGIVLNIVEPKSNQIVDGKIDFLAKVDLEKYDLEARVVDLNGEILGSIFLNYINVEGNVLVSGEISVDKSIEDKIAAIKVFELLPTPNTADEFEVGAVPIVFKTYSDARSESLKVWSPQANQTIDSDSILIKGDVLHSEANPIFVRFTLSDRSITGEQVIESEFGLDFVKFENILEITSDSKSKKGLLQFFRKNNDGSESIILEIPLILK